MKLDASKELLMISSEPGFWGQERKPWVSLELPLLQSELKQNGLNIKLTDIHQMALKAANIQDQYIVYGFSQRAHVREYIKDLLCFLKQENTLIPSLDLLLCHENKGYAQLYRERLGLFDPKGWYLNDIAQISQLDISYPIVLKSIIGTNGKTVFLCKNPAELKKRIRSFSKSIDWFVHIDFLRREYLRNKRKYPGYSRFEPKQDAEGWLRYMTPGANFLLQEYVSELDCDYRIIAVGKRFYLMQRMVNKGDFRASGTKRFVFNATPPEGLLDFALDVFTRFDAPFLAMDIGHKKGKNYLFEFQAMHFGTAAIVRSSGYWLHQAGAWIFQKENSVLEPVLALGLADYLNGKL